MSERAEKVGTALAVMLADHDVDAHGSLYLDIGATNVRLLGP